MKHPLRFDDGLQDIAVIRTTFGTLDRFPPDDPVRTEMQAIVAEAQANLARRLQEFCDRMQGDPAPASSAIYHEKFRAGALDMMLRGYPSRDLNFTMKVNVFDADESLRYSLEFAGLADIEAALRMTAHQFVLALHHEVLQAVQNREHFRDRATFDRQVARKYVALLFLHNSTTDSR